MPFQFYQNIYQIGRGGGGGGGGGEKTGIRRKKNLRERVVLGR